MKKIFFIILVALLGSPSLVSAQSTSVTAESTKVQNTCVDLKYNLSYRSRDARTSGEVSQLQGFLIANGYLSSEPTGYFGAATLSAVKKFQVFATLSSAGGPGFGSIGPKSRAKIKGMTCVEVTTMSPAPSPSQSANQSASIFGAFEKPVAPAQIAVAPWRYSWTRNLESGSPYVDDVLALQAALAKDGLFSGEITGSYSMSTYFSVKSFQQKHNITQTGFVGPTTRAKLNSLYGPEVGL